MKITLFLMSQKGYETLKAIKEHGLLDVVDLVVGSRDKNVEKDYYEEIRDLCRVSGLRHVNRLDDFSVTSDYVLSISWRWLIKNSDTKLIILHDSLLPKYRGFAPLVNMLINREPKIGVTAIFAEEKFDTGNIICQYSTEIQYPITIAEAISLISKNYIDCTLFILENLKKSLPLPSEKQDQLQASYSLWRDEEDYFIDWQQTAAEICNFINAVSSPYKGAAAMIDGKVVRIISAVESEDLKIENRDCGKVLMMEGGLPLVVCREGIIKITGLIADETGENLLPLKNFRTRFKTI